LNQHRSIGQIILDLLQGKTTIRDAPTYGELYRSVCRECGRVVSYRDFQKELDKHQRDKRIQVEKDPHNRSANRIFLTPSAPFGQHDYKLMLAWRLKGFLEGLFKKEPYLTPLVPLHGYGDLGGWERKRPDLKEFIHNAPYWQKYSEAEAKEMLSISLATWSPIYRKWAGNRSLSLQSILRSPNRSVLEERIGEYNGLIIKVNVDEIIQAWIQNRPIDRQKIIKNLRKTLASYARGEYVEIMNENYWLSSMDLFKNVSKNLVKAP